MAKKYKRVKSDVRIMQLMSSYDPQCPTFEGTRNWEDVYGD
jgi:hypothetical protein